MSKKEALAIGILDIQDLGFQINIYEDVTSENLAIGYDMNFIYDEKEDWIQFIIEVEYINSINNNRVIYSTVLSKFYVNNLNQYLNEEKSLNLPLGTLEVLFGISLTHSRAILAKNTAGTRFKDFYIPVVNARLLLRSLLDHKITTTDYRENDISEGAASSMH